jgi:hypothetical protein
MMLRNISLLILARGRQNERPRSQAKPGHFERDTLIFSAPIGAVL